MRISKRIFSATVAFLLLLSFASCGVSNSPTESGTETSEQEGTVIDAVIEDSTESSVPEDTSETNTVTEPSETETTKPADEEAIENPQEGNSKTMIDVKVGSTVLTATLMENPSAKAFAEQLKQGEITVSMQDYGGFEKVGSLPESIVSNDDRITAEPGDIILYQGNQITVYYGTNTYSLTRLGKMNGVNATELKALLGGGNVTVTFRLHEKNASESTPLATTDYTVNGVTFKMIYVEHGTFTMGSDNKNVQFSESPAHEVTLTNDYLIGETEVTEALWNAVMGNGGGSNSMPKTSVTWSQAHDFIDRLNSIAHEQGLIPDDVIFILPTEAQWEFAAKGGNESKGYTYSGSNNINDVAVTYENSGSNSPIQVKSKAPNELGIYDMSGNAYEWVDDCGGNYSSDAQTDPQNTSGRNYVKRGGSNYHSFSSEPYLFTTTGRYFYSSTDWTIGFRIGLQ